MSHNRFYINTMKKLLVLFVLLSGCCGMLDMRTMCSQSPNLDLRDRCFSTLAFRESNSQMCGEVQNATARDYCVMKIAISELNESECYNIQSNLREECERVVVGVKGNNSLICNLIKDNETAEVCWIRVS